MGFLSVGRSEPISGQSIGIGKPAKVINEKLNSVFGETPIQNSDSDVTQIQITSKPITYVSEDMTQEILSSQINSSNPPLEQLSTKQEFDMLKKTLLANSKITKREDPKLGTCYSCRGHETNMRGKEGAIDLAATTLKDLVYNKKEYLELSKKDPKELTPEEGLEVFAYKQTLKAMQLTIDENGNLVNTEDCEYI